jgi:hypothetical protein
MPTGMPPKETPSPSSAPGSRTSLEIASQPECWRQAAKAAPQYAPALPRRGERVAVVGCGTSWFMASPTRRCASRAAMARPTPSPLPSFRPGAVTTGSWPSLARARPPKYWTCSAGCAAPSPPPR